MFLLKRSHIRNKKGQFSAIDFHFGQQSKREVSNARSIDTRTTDECGVDSSEMHREGMQCPKPRFRDPQFVVVAGDGPWPYPTLPPFPAMKQLPPTPAARAWCDPLSGRAGPKPFGAGRKGAGAPRRSQATTSGSSSEKPRMMGSSSSSSSASPPLSAPVLKVVAPDRVS